MADTFYGLPEGSIIFGVEGLPASMPEEKKSEYIKDLSSKICSHCHTLFGGTWEVKRNMKAKGIASLRSHS